MQARMPHQETKKGAAERSTSDDIEMRTVGAMSVPNVVGTAIPDNDDVESDSEFGGFEESTFPENDEPIVQDGLVRQEGSSRATFMFENIAYDVDTATAPIAEQFGFGQYLELGSMFVEDDIDNY